MSLRIVPAAEHPRHTTAALGAPSAPGVHDALRSNLGLSHPAPKSSVPSSSRSSNNNNSNPHTTAEPQIVSAHPLESRLARWRAQQEGLKMSLLRRQFGLAEPVKRQMELAIVRNGEWRPAVLGAGAGAGASGDGVHADILAGRDNELDWEDVFDGREFRDVPDFHTEMETRFGMGW